ncbi:unnamed protein product, partial [marine sediment metagenome]
MQKTMTVPDKEYKERRLQELEWERTVRFIPDGVQTMSKMPSRYIQPFYPLYIDKAAGAYVYSGSKKWLDYTCSLGAILLGYHNREVDTAVIEQLSRGIIHPLPNRLETKLAETIVDLIPSAEMVRFVKTGSEATNAAVRIARAATGKDGVVVCGYNGWADFYMSTTDKKKGIPSALFPLSGQVKYNDFEKVQDMFSLSNEVQREVAAIILEPYIYDEPKDDFVRKVVEFAHQNEALVIFDEVVTGFRTKGFSAQKMFDITPDLTCLGKAMANGLPISAVCGKKEFMKELTGDCFVSSTFGAELLSIAAALATIKVLKSKDVIDRIWERGQLLKDGFNEMAADLKGVECVGYPCRTEFRFPTETHRSLLWQEC